MTATTAATYNGWKNRETWNVALWAQNDEGLYSLARAYATYPNPYACFVEALRDDLNLTETPDGVAYNDSGLDIDALDAMIRELDA